ncbi:GPO family capsid scaffolding protein [Sphingobium sp.]|uniref:GPO family capsid scaffolding protein n=1 Tax=Sphingobium sp. TaxID=1912891 RepID=UPI00257DA6D1|nr:GPO family capsid scaffolding protein [Sphingobium sp.]MBR2270429.1 GPO family capsid scaffolding protein [Sphingobium sp.]
MKTKPFLLATAGSTVDGRTIDEKMLKEMASSYDPKTYGARLNIEHIRGVSGEKPFRAYGDIESLSTAMVDVNFNGQTEKRLGLYGVFDVTGDAKALNDASQKVYPSIEIEDNFAGKGFAYLMGCALTDSPASIATERLQFNRARPGVLNFSRDESALLEFAEDKGDQDGATFLTGLKGLFDDFAAKFAAPKQEEKPTPPAKEDAAAPFDFTAMQPFFESLTKTIATGMDAMRNEFRGEIDGLALQFKKLSEEKEDTPSGNYSRRPPSDGKSGAYNGVF